MESTTRVRCLLARAALPLVTLLAAACSPGGEPAPSEWRDQAHRPSEVAGVGWELVPDLDLEVEGMRLRTNSIGARDGEPVEGDDVFRVAVMGGCFAFGLGLDGEAAWPRRLEREMTASILVMGRTVDFLDLAVCGHDAPRQVALLERRGLDLDPWMAVLEHSLEDPAAPLTASLRDLAGSPPVSFAELHDTSGEPWQAMGEAWGRARELCAARRIPLMLVVVPRLDGGAWEDYPFRALHAQVTAEGRRRGLVVLDLLERFEAEPPASLVTAGERPRPSARAHEIAADAFKRLLYSSGALTQILEAH
jgi:hypothetical protein